MFFSSESSSNSSYPLFYNQSSIFTNTIPENNNNILFHQQHFHNHNHNYGRYNNYIFQQPTNHPSISENPIFKIPSINQENTNNNTLNYPSNLMMMNHMSSTRKTVNNKKKDRHTKICTAQGIRDRRVRLSMSIAREFFNLQDMLGYDKASKTLGWLLGKSKAAIDELASRSNNNIVTSGDDDDENNSSSKKRKRGEVGSFNKDQNLGEEVKRREKARERARERTRKKKIVVDDDQNNDQHQLENLDHHHQRGQKDSMICESSSAAASLNTAPIFSKGVNVGETVVIKGSSKSRSESSFGYNHGTISSKDDDQENCNYYNDCFTKSASEGCTYGGIMQSPGLLPALNIINLSTEIHINARPWDTYSSNQNLH